MSEFGPTEPLEHRPRTIPRNLILGAATALVIATGAGVATAATASSPTPAPSATPTEAETTVTATIAPTPSEPPKRERARAFGGIRSEVVVPKEGGGYQTIANQTGEVTAVDGDSLTVKSEDDFSRTYTVNDTTRVSAGRQGLTAIQNGDTVHVTAVVDGESATAQHVTDLTRPEGGAEVFPGRFYLLPDPAGIKRLPDIKRHVPESDGTTKD